MSHLIYLHVAFGTLAVLAGLLASVAPKGRALHIYAGRFYVLSMIIMAVAGGLFAAFLPQAINVLAAALTIYLVITAWRAAMQTRVERHIVELGACAIILFVAILAFILAFKGMNAVDGSVHGYRYEAYCFIGSLAFYAGLCDVYVLVRGHIAGWQKQRRHIWRMCLSYFIAVGSLFTGPGNSVFPNIIREMGILALPELFVLVFMFYWLVRTWVHKLKTHRQ